MKLTVAVGLAPSSNNAYKTIVIKGRAIRGLTTEGVQYKKATRLQVQSAARRAGWTYVAGQRLALHLIVTFADMRRADISNRVKLVEDAIAQALGFDDSVIDRLLIERTAPGEPGCTIELEVLQ